MAETKSAAQGSAGAAAPASADRFRLTLVTGGILLALALAVLLLRLQRLSELPPGIDAGEGVNGIDALRVLQGEHAVFFSSHPAKFGGREGLAMYAIALSISLFGRTEFALRLPTALASAGTVFVVFWLGQLLFGRDGDSGRATPWRGLMVGGVASGLMAVSLGLTIMGRTAYRTSWLPFFLCLCLALLWHGWRQRARGGGAWWWCVLAGICAGLLPYTYIPGRFALVLFLFFGLSFLLPQRGKTFAGQASGKSSPLLLLRAELPWIGVFVGVAAIVSVPLVIHFALHPDDFFSRSNHVLIFLPEISQGNPLAALVFNVWDHVLAFGFRGDPVWRHNFTERPMLHPWEALLFWLGVVMTARRWQRPANRLLLLWLCTLTLPAFLSRDTVPNTLRMIGASPAVYLLIGVGLWEVYQFLEARFFRQKRGEVAIAAGTVVGSLILVQGVLTHRTYFQQWAAAPETYEAYQTNWTELARTLNARPSASDKVFLIPVYEWDSSYSWRYSFQYLYRGPAQTPMLYTVPLDLASKVESTLAAMENLSAASIVDWDNEFVGGYPIADEQIDYLLGKYGRFQGSEDGPSFHIRTYTDISLDRPWTYYEYLEPLAVHYDGGISLHGLALGQGTEQLSSQQPFILGPGQATWVAMQWQSAPGLETEYSISLRLHSAEGGVVYQQDAVLRDSNSASTKRWSAGERVDTLHYLDLPANIAPGEYELRLVAYDFETLKPTVEIGVWQPDTVLARLRIEEVQ